MSVRTMVYEYRRSIRLAKKAYASAPIKEDPNSIERTIISEMLSDMHFALAWIHCGFNPYHKCGAYRRSEVQFMDPDLMDAIELESKPQDARELSDMERIDIKIALSKLTERETDIYVMHHAEMLPLDEIAELLGVKKSTVATTIRRAQKKINKAIGGRS
ncbi:sigma-70 family RNA polymerase sigma factor [Sporolactobacillus nakayamae]|uniref:RNA polymerase sigma-70 factor, ECF subfamily n=1 Tax=Sporolactobacillus nakayamae TaxID=269670 RepID=A0A1I2P9G3_9BACL|nr:sigma-70 family RNA polymerase sigma factor [Sporolactobacillus nakayamae]SFG10276.1 RNA polymerase sigma-70 factor, ECF subfamily [Sporolactobacillus nakayamae]